MGTSRVRSGERYPALAPFFLVFVVGCLVDRILPEVILWQYFFVLLPFESYNRFLGTLTGGAFPGHQVYPLDVRLDINKLNLGGVEFSLTVGTLNH